MSGDADRLRKQGLEVETVEDIIGNGKEGGPANVPFMPARLGNTPPLPEPGIYFGMTDEEYHALPALSSSGVKKMAASCLLFWGNCSWLNPDWEDEKAEKEKGKDHLPIGKAYGCRILEGKAAFDSRYIDKPDKPDFGAGVIESSDEIKNRIRELGAAMDPVVKPLGTIKEEGSEARRQAKKEDWIKQLQELDPEAKILDVLMAEWNREFEAQHAGKVQLPSKLVRRIALAARMIENDPDIAPHLKGGHAEVVLIWFCAETGVPMKAKLDYMKIKEILDMKTLANQRERSIEQAIRWEIAGWKYTLQPSVYTEGAKAVRQLVREHGASVIHSRDWPVDDDTIALKAKQEEHAERVAWAMKWASHVEPDDWGWVFQMKGVAPVTRLVWYPRGTIKMMTDDIISLQKKRFRAASETYGVEPWLDLAKPYWINDEDIPPSAVEI